MQNNIRYKLFTGILIVFCLMVGIQGTNVQAYPLASDSPQKLLIPLYNYPNWWNPDSYFWDDIAEANNLVPITVIINPDNGPGDCPPNPDYQKGLKTLHAAGVSILGYVNTGYGERDIQDVKTDIDLYVQCFNIDGIFFDEASSDQEKVSYYQTLYNYVQEKQSGAVVVNDFGVVPHQDYSGIGTSILCVFEDEFSNFIGWTPPSWITSERSLALVHNTPNDDLQTALEHLSKENIGWFYLTSDILLNPWDTLPPYFPDLVKAVSD